MGAIPIIGSVIGGLFKKPKVPKVPIVPPPATPRANSSILAKTLLREGSLANKRKDASGEALGGVKTKLGG